MPPMKDKLSTLAAIVLPLLILVAAFAPMLQRLGFYWDDWPSIWFLHVFGPQGFITGFAEDRPLLAGVFLLTTPLLGTSPLAWQVAAIVCRALAALALFVALHAIWPTRRMENGAVAILFTLYPGFGQQYIAVTYTNAFLLYALYLSSHAAMLWGFRSAGSRRIALLAYAIVAAALSLLTTEYFVGLELLRPALLLLLPDAAPLRARLWQAARRSLLFAPVLLLVIGYRLLTPTPRASVTLFSQFSQAPLTTALDLLRTLAQDFIQVNLGGWAAGLNLRALNDFDAIVPLLFAGSAISAALLAGAYAWLADTSPTGRAAAPQPLSNRQWGLQAALLGVYAFLVSGWPVWVSNLRLDLIFPWDRLTLMMLPAAALLAVGVLRLIGGPRPLFVALLALLVGLCSGAQFSTRLAYRQEWLAQQNFFWQLTWRMPQVQPGTLLLTSEIPFTYYTDNSLSAPLNWVYAPAATGPEMALLLHDIEARLGNSLANFDPGQTVDEPYRAAYFRGNTSQAVVLFYDPPRCLKVLNPAIDRFLPVKPLYIREAVPLSRLDQIVLAPANPAVPPQAFFGPPPKPNWCFYFEKAELYAQFEDWPQAAEMADKALKINRHYTEKNIAELIPFIEAYAHTGQWQKAAELNAQAMTTWDKMQYVLCDVWTRLEQTTPASPERSTALQSVGAQIKCSFSQP